MVQAVLVGCGAMSKTWLEAARQADGVSITGLVDLDAERARARAKEFDLDGIAIGTDLDAILEKLGRTQSSMSWFPPHGGMWRSRRSITVAIS